MPRSASAISETIHAGPAFPGDFPPATPSAFQTQASPEVSPTSSSRICHAAFHASQTRDDARSGDSRTARNRAFASVQSGQNGQFRRGRSPQGAVSSRAATDPGSAPHRCALRRARDDGSFGLSARFGPGALSTSRLDKMDKPVPGCGGGATPWPFSRRRTGRKDGHGHKRVAFRRRCGKCRNSVACCGAARPAPAGG